MKKTFCIKSIFYITSALSFCMPSLRAEVLTIDNYVDQVTKQNQGYMATQKGMEAGQSKSTEGELALSYMLFSNLQYLNDKRPSNLAFITGDRNAVSTYSLGFSKQTSFGVKAALSYNVNYFYLHGANPTYIASNSYYQNNPELDLSLSLWQNSFGRQTRAMIETTEAKNLSYAYSNSYNSKVTLSNAEALYWRLSLTRDFVKIQRANLETVQKIRDWNKKRVSTHLADDVDLLQSEANLKMRQMDLEMALDEEKMATRSFNTARNVQSDDLNEELQGISVDEVIALAVPEKRGVRDDVTSYKEASIAAAANAKLSKDKNAPTFDLFANLTLNGKDPTFDQSFKQSWGGNYPYTIVGLKFVAPLDFGNIRRINSGYEADKISADYAYQRKRFEADREWDDLVKKLEETKQKLKISKELEDAQYNKYVYEQKRQLRGQTTTYQVLTFEQDYANAQYNRVKIESDILGYVAQMKTFSGKEEI